MTAINKRKLERFELKIPAHLHVVDKNETRAFKFMTENICSGGAFLSADQKIPISTKVNIHLFLSVKRFKKIEANNVFIKVDGAVVRTEDNGLAVCFDNNYKITPMHS